MPLPTAAHAVASDPTGHIAATVARKARSKAFKATHSNGPSHKAKPPGALRKRAPKVSRVPTNVAPHDTAGRLRQMGFKSASGVNYLRAWVALTGPGTSYGVALPMQVAAARTVAQLRIAIANSDMEGEPVSIWMDPDDCKLLLYWNLPDEEMQPYRSVFGLQALTKRNDVLEVPYSAFPENVNTPAYRQQAVHMDHVLSRDRSSIWIDAVADDTRHVVTVTRVTDPYEARDALPLHLMPAVRGAVAPLELPITHCPGEGGQITVTANVPEHLRGDVGAGELSMLVPKETVGYAERHLKALAGRLADYATSRLAPRMQVPRCDFELPY